MSTESTKPTDTASELHDQFAEAAKVRSTLRGNIEKRKQMADYLPPLDDMIQIERMRSKGTAYEYSTMREASMGI